jgi:predicted DNA-binding transcriptional regulator YafY
MIRPMSRALRVMELEELLKARDTTTVAELAQALGVGERSIRRDLATLRERGLPISGDPGPGGGIRLEGERGLTAVHLSLAEIVSLWLAARLAQAASDLPWSPAANSALTKLLGSLPKARAKELRALCRRVIIGAAPSAQVVASAGSTPKELLSRFEQAFSRGHGLGFDYRDRNGQRSTRRTEPHGLLVQSPVWYLLTRDIDKDGPRMFRMDRISRPHVLPELHFRPDAAVIWSQLPEDCEFWPLLGERPGKVLG